MATTSNSNVISVINNNANDNIIVDINNKRLFFNKRLINNTMYELLLINTANSLNSFIMEYDKHLHDFIANEQETIKCFLQIVDKYED